MTDGALIPNAEQQFFDLADEPLSGGFVYTYEVGSTTPKLTYVDQAQTTPNTNPIILDSLGRCIIWGAGSYRQVVTDSVGNLIWDQVTSDGGIGDVRDDIATVQTEVDVLQDQVATLNDALLSSKLFLDKTKVPDGTTYTTTASDTGTTFFSLAGDGPGPLTFVLPHPTSINRGWYAFFVRQSIDVVIEVNGGLGELIEAPNVASTVIALAAFDWENALISFDGTNFEILSATPRTWFALGAFPAESTARPQYNSSLYSVGDHTVIVPAASIQFTLVGGGGAGGSGGGGGGGGSLVVAQLNGLTIGNSLTLQVAPGGNGFGGADGQAGGSTVLVSGTQIIDSVIAGGGIGGQGGNFGTGGGGGSGSGATIIATGNRGYASYQVGIPGNGAPGQIGSFGAGGDGSQTYPDAGNNGNQGVAILEWFT